MICAVPCLRLRLWRSRTRAALCDRSASRAAAPGLGGSRHSLRRSAASTGTGRSRLGATAARRRLCPGGFPSPGPGVFRLLLAVPSHVSGRTRSVQNSASACCMSQKLSCTVCPGRTTRTTICLAPSQCLVLYHCRAPQRAGPRRCRRDGGTEGRRSARVTPRPSTFSPPPCGTSDTAAGPGRALPCRRRLSRACRGRRECRRSSAPRPPPGRRLSALGRRHSARHPSDRSGRWRGRWQGRWRGRAHRASLASCRAAHPGRDRGSGPGPSFRRLVDRTPTEAAHRRHALPHAHARPSL